MKSSNIWDKDFIVDVILLAVTDTVSMFVMMGRTRCDVTNKCPYTSMMNVQRWSDCSDCVLDSVTNCL